MERAKPLPRYRLERLAWRNRKLFKPDDGQVRPVHIKRKSSAVLRAVLAENGVTR